MRENGILMLVDKFDQENIMPLVAQIMEYNMMEEELQPDAITIIINSPGGSVHSAFHLIDIMKTSDIPIHTVGQGLVASCGILTLMAGDKGHRRVTHNTSVMSHQYSWGSSGKEHEFYAKVKEFEFSPQRMDRATTRSALRSQRLTFVSTYSRYRHVVVPRRNASSMV